MDNRVESPSWLPDGAAPADTGESATEGTTPAAGQGAADDALTYGSNGSYVYEGESSYVYEGENGADGAYGYATGPAAGGPSGGSGSAPGESTGGAFGGGGHGAFGGGSPSAFGTDSGRGHGGGRPASAFGAGTGGSYGGETGRAPHVPPPPPPYQAQTPALTQPDLTGASRAATAAFGVTRKRQKKQKKQAAVEPRRANLMVARLDPWSVMKFSFLMSLAAWLVLFVAVALLYYFLSKLGVFSSIQQTLQSVTSSRGSSGVQLSKYVSASKVLGYTVLLGAVNVVIITALSTVGAVIYNLVTRLGGGIEVTLRESD